MDAVAIGGFGFEGTKGWKGIKWMPLPEGRKGGVSEVATMCIDWSVLRNAAPPLPFPPPTYAPGRPIREHEGECDGGVEETDAVLGNDAGDVEADRVREAVCGECATGKVGWVSG
jgi:hypothetical protein